MNGQCTGGRAAADRRQALVSEVIETQGRLTRVAFRTASHSLDQVKFSLKQLRGLFTIGFEGTLTVGRLAELLGRGQPSTSALLERLVQAGMVERSQDPADRRRTLVRLSPQGRETVAQFMDIQRAWDLTYLPRLREEDLEALLQGLRAVVAAASADPAGASAGSSRPERSA